MISQRPRDAERQGPELLHNALDAWQYCCQAHLWHLQINSLPNRISERARKTSLWQMLAIQALLQQVYDV